MAYRPPGVPSFVPSSRRFLGQPDLKLCYVKLIASDPVLPHAVKQHGRPANTRLRSIRAKVAQMANSGESSHVSANSHTTNTMTTVLNVACPTPPPVLNPENDW